VYKKNKPPITILPYTENIMTLGWFVFMHSSPPTAAEAASSSSSLPPLSPIKYDPRDRSPHPEETDDPAQGGQIHVGLDEQHQRQP